jgi:protein-tyrosine phosphatase
MEGIIDIHNHILFRVDDGSDSKEKSLEMIKREYEQGVRKIIMTPHYHAGECMPKADVMQERFRELKEDVHTQIPDMQLFLGNEIMASIDMVELLENGRVFPLADSRYVLVEFYPSVQYSAMEKDLNQILNGGYIPIVAHCERYRCLRKALKVINSSNFNHLIEMGAYMQVNVSTVFSKDHKFVDKLIENDYLHFIASDAHSLGVRGIFWDKCVKYLEKKYDKKYIESILIENPEKIINNQYI